MSSALPASELPIALGRFHATSDARIALTLLAAHELARGAWNRITLQAIVRRPGPSDARFRAIDLGRFVVPDAATEREVLDALESYAQSFSVALSIREPGPGCALAADEWIRAQGPAPRALWTIAWAALWYDENGREHESEDERVVEASTASEALGVARAARGRLDVPSTAAIASAIEHVRELGEPWPPLWAGGHDPPVSTLDRDTVRRASMRGTPPSAIFAQHPPASPLDAMGALARGWSARLPEVVAAAQLVRGERTAASADAELGAVCRAHEHEWLLALRVADAIAADRVDADLVAMARRAGAIRCIQAFREGADLGLAEAKTLVATLDGLGDAATEPIVLSREIARVRTSRTR